MPKTYNDIYLELRRKLKALGISSYDLEARLLCAAAAGKKPAQFLRDIRLYADSAVEEKTRGFLKRRSEGEPLAYIVGTCDFYGLELDINSDVLIPRVDTEVLAGTVIDILKPKMRPTRFLDLCTGSGCVGLAIAANVPGTRGVLSDKSREAVALARANSLKLNLSSRVTCIEADVFERPPMLLGTFDMIVCNPPYIPSTDIIGLDVSVRDYEPHTALDGGDDGLDFYRAIIPSWKEIVKPGGIMAFECGIGQAESVRRLMEDSLLHGIRTKKDTLGIERVVFGSV